jgi:hypothetical protein
VGPHPHGTQGNSLGDKALSKTKSKPKKEPSAPRSNPGEARYLERPLAPAPKSVFVGVCVAVVILMIGASNTGNDYLDAFACTAVLAFAAVTLDFFGRREATRRPNAIYRSDRLPEFSTRVKNAMRILTLFALLVVVTERARPGVHNSPLPYFLAAAFIFFVIPQMLAWRAVADSERLQSAPKSKRPNKTVTAKKKVRNS